MDLLGHLRTRARANRLANLRLGNAMAALSDEAFQARRTSFFPSLAATLKHILAVDRYYIAALRGEGDMERQWRETPACGSANDWAAAQAASDRRLIEHLDAIGAADLEAVVELDRGDGKVQRERRGHVVAHLLDHQVHHRGQAHAMLAGTEVAPPQLDEFLMPSEAHLREREMQALGWSEADMFAGPAPGR